MCTPTPGSGRACSTARARPPAVACSIHTGYQSRCPEVVSISLPKPSGPVAHRARVPTVLFGISGSRNALCGRAPRPAGRAGGHGGPGGRPGGAAGGRAGARAGAAAPRGAGAGGAVLPQPAPGRGARGGLEAALPSPVAVLGARPAARRRLAGHLLRPRPGPSRRRWHPRGCCLPVGLSATCVPAALGRQQAVTHSPCCPAWTSHGPMLMDRGLFTQADKKVAALVQELVWPNQRLRAVQDMAAMQYEATVRFAP